MKASAFIPPIAILFLAKSIRWVLILAPCSIDLFFKILGRNGLNYVFNKAPQNLQSIKSKHLKVFKIINAAQLDSVKKIVLQPRGFEEVSLEKVYGTSGGGKYSVFFDQLAVYLFSGAILSPNSDFVKIGQNVYWDKFNKPQLPMIIPGDSDLIAHNCNEAIMIDAKPEMIVDCGFSLLGMKPNSWGHFIANCLPKLKALERIKEPSLQILLPSSVDTHIQEVIRILAGRLGYNQITLIDNNTTVLCNKLYHCSMPSFLADHALTVHPSFAVISEYSKRAIHEFSKYLANGIQRRDARKLFIARTTARNIKNYKEIEAYFESLGFNIVHPHMHSLSEKIEIFQSATHVVGPGSSGFANMLFCKPKTKALILSNLSRTLDLYFDLFSDERYFNIDITLLTGVDDEPGAPHSQFSISTAKITKFIEESGFLS